MGEIGSRYQYFISWSIKKASEILHEMNRDGLEKWQVRVLRKAYCLAERYEEDVANGWRMLR